MGREAAQGTYETIDYANTQENAMISLAPERTRVLAKARQRERFSDVVEVPFKPRLRGYAISLVSSVLAGRSVQLTVAPDYKAGE